jgi:peptidoglycan-associated lipoprotein
MDMYWSNMMKVKYLLCGSALSIALVACSADDNYEADLFDAPAGTQIESGNFGSATSNNMAALTGMLNLEMIKNLTRLFASETSPTINFAFNSSKLDASAQAALRAQADWIKAHPNITFRVYGHTDKVGSNAYNKRLGLRRARNAVNFLIKQGIPKEKLEAVVSLGETRPLVITEAPNRQNRRTITEVKGFYAGKTGPGIDGKYAVNIYNTYISTAQRVTLPQATTIISQLNISGGAGTPAQ